MSASGVVLCGFAVAAGLGVARLARRRRPDPAPCTTAGTLHALVAHCCGEAEAEAFAPSGRRATALDGQRPAGDADFDAAARLLARSLGPDLASLLVTLLRHPAMGPPQTLLPQIDAVQTAMRQSRCILDVVIDRSEQGMYFYDRDLRLVMWNRAGAEILELPEGSLYPGATLEEVVGACAARGLYGPGAIAELTASRLTTIRDSAAITRTHSMDGSKIFDMRSVPMPDGGLLILNTDVTQQALTERQLEAENETLERRVRERTEQLESLNAAYLKAKAEAEDANISKTRFLAAASHDLLQPLNAARLYAASLKERVRAHSAADDSLALALNVEESLEAVEDMLTALLDISHLDAGATKTEIAVFRIDDILRALYREFEPSAGAKGIALTIVPSSLPVRSDCRLLRRLLQNLISNAIKYTVEGRVIVGVRRRGEWACIEIWDTGLGIPKARQADVFREFERLPSAVMTAPGAGLGLSIVERLSRILNHGIKIRSKPGRGSVFSVLVPRAAELPVRTAANGLQSKPRSLEGLVVAAIDNEPAILRGMEALLSGWDCKIIVGGDLDTVETILRDRGLVPDVIIADLHVGEIDGLAAIAALRARFGACQAVLVTADRSPRVCTLAQAADVRLLNKPLKPAALRSLLSQWHLVRQVAR